MNGRQSPAIFPEAVRILGPRPLLVCHNDADGLSAGVILLKTLQRRSVEPILRIVGKGENAYSRDFSAEVRHRVAVEGITGLLITDLGVSSDLPMPGLPTILVDHHVPTGIPQDATVITGIDDVPIPTSSLLAHRAAAACGPAGDLLWLAAIGIIGDMAEDAGFAEMAAARAGSGITALRKAASLVNAPRRSSSADASPAFALLAKADGPKAVLSGAHPETALLLAARAEVKAELDAARQAAPRIVGPVAMVKFHSPCQVHPLIAQAWSRRLKVPIAMAANSGYRPGWVHFAARAGGAGGEVDIPAFLAGVRPPGADEQYGKGHKAASGGALRIADWNIFVRSLGFGPEMEETERAEAA
ncbi:phosphoesterase [Aureimonas sp. Leaf454]|uniref:DHH family phosphoesterase n=1 Tax=Aureimonas sp. Leaf454 TaxID=1736381 RepID=UPI0006F78920|nr:DHH family phosphoesterase [Aureimonas sp. Leaf454]KQT46276.1 phosphoesterase [Aureimonas sp. Leaf454]